MGTDERIYMFGCNLVRSWMVGGGIFPFILLLSPFLNENLYFFIDFIKDDDISIS